MRTGRDCREFSSLQKVGFAPDPSPHPASCRRRLRHSAAGELPKRLNAVHNVAQMRLGDAVVREPALLLARQEPGPLHQPQVLGRHVAGNLARLGELANRESPLQQHLHDSQAMRVGEGPQALRGPFEGIERKQPKLICSCHKYIHYSQLTQAV